MSPCRVDVVVLSGDLANIPMELQLTSTDEELAKHHQDLTRVVKQFVPLAKQVFYIPGNVSLIVKLLFLSVCDAMITVHVLFIRKILTKIHSCCFS